MTPPLSSDGAGPSTYVRSQRSSRAPACFADGDTCANLPQVPRLLRGWEPRWESSPGDAAAPAAPVRSMEGEESDRGPCLEGTCPPLEQALQTPGEKAGKSGSVTIKHLLCFKEHHGESGKKNLKMREKFCKSSIWEKISIYYT